VPSGQALPGFLITAPSSVCVPDVIIVLAVWIQNQRKQKAVHCGALPHAGVASSHALPGYLITALKLCAFLLYLAR